MNKYKFLARVRAKGDDSGCALADVIEFFDRSPRASRREAVRRASLSIANESMVAGENVGTTIDAGSTEGTAASRAPAVAAEASDDAGDGDSEPEPEPERRPLSASSCQWRARAKNVSALASHPLADALVTHGARIPDALVNFDSLPDAAHVRLPVVCGLFACSPATAWRRAKAGTIPAPVKLSERVTAWRVGDLRAVLAEFRA